MSRSRLIEVASVVAVWLAGAAVFFREQWTSGFKTLEGNDGDMRLAVYLCEHWFRVFHGQASWLNPGFFYPVKGLLGWSDTFFLYEVFYTPLRLVGCDPFLALQITLILLSLVGFASIVALVRVAFGASKWMALAGGLIFTFANSLWLHAGAAQDSALYLVPLVVLLAVLAWRAAGEGRGRPALLLGAGGGLLAALLAYTSYYVTYFSFVCAGVLIVVLVVSSPRRAWEWVRDGVTRRWPAVAVTAGAMLVGLVPFALTYLPARPDDPGSTYADVMVYAARARDVLNVGSGNLLWSSAVHHLVSGIDYGMYEVSYAVTPVLLICAVLGGGWCAWRVRTGRAARPVPARMAAGLAATAVVGELIPMHTRIGTPWALFYHLPGAGAMRAIDRIGLVAGLAAVLALVAAATELWAHLASHRQPLLRVAVAGVLAVAVLEQVNTSPTSSVDRAAQTRILAGLGRPPGSCRSFYVVDSRSDLPFFESQIDAMLISQRLGLPTVNGYTAYNPKGWDLADIGSPSYLDSVSQWVGTRAVAAGLCQFDLADGEWSSAATPG